MDKETKDRFFDELMKKTYDKIYMFVGRGCKDREFVEDVVQETFYEAYRKAEILMEHPNQIGWLYNTAKNKRLKLWEKKKDLYLAYQEYAKEEVADRIEHDYEEIELAETIKASVSEKEYDMLCDYYLNGYSSVEVAEKYGVDKGGIRMRMSRLRRKLKEDIVVGWCIFFVCVWRFL